MELYKDVQSASQNVTANMPITPDVLPVTQPTVSKH